MTDKKIREALRQAQQAVEQANQALASVMQELDNDSLGKVTGAGDPFGDVPRPGLEPIDPGARENG